MDNFSSVRVRQVLFLFTILLIGGLLFWQMRFLFSSFLGAIMLYTVLRNPILWLIEKQRWHRITAVVLVLVLMITILVVPTYFSGQVLYKRLTGYLKNTDALTSSFLQIHTYVKTRFDIDIINPETIARIKNISVDITTNFLNSLLSLLTTLLFTFFILCFMLCNIRKMENWVQKTLPFKKANSDQLEKKITSIVLSNTIVIPILAIIQGCSATLGYWIFNVPDFMFWGIVTGIASAIPLVGTALVTVPMSLYVMSGGHITNGVGLLIYATVVLGGGDSLVRLLIGKKFANLHPMITIFGIIVGVNLLGFMGLIFGPLLISLFLLLIKIYQDEFRDVKTLQ